MSKRASVALAAVLWFGVTQLGHCAMPAIDAVADTASVTPSASAAEPANPAPLIAVPPASVGQWYNLGAYWAPWLAGDGPVPMSGPNAPTRVAGWLRPANPKDKTSQNEWLAIVIVQLAPGTKAPCAIQATSLDVAGSGCLRLRRNADFDQWLQAAQPVLYRWVDKHGWSSLPRAWAAYRVPSASGGAVEVHVLFTPSLIEPATRNASDFLTSGLPGQQWARQLAAAVNALNGAAGNVFTVPPFPFAPGPHVEPEAALPDMLPAKSAASASAPASPAVAEQILHMPAARPEQK
ncbi:MAG: hypothetical protein LBH10_00445 [Burkholderiaceae bacterium]|jgi:hypothetical protein|nr:hypothetical protein [Burkholderiaceae bacterium]